MRPSCSVTVMSDAREPSTTWLLVTANTPRKPSIFISTPDPDSSAGRPFVAFGFTASTATTDGISLLTAASNCGPPPGAGSEAGAVGDGRQRRRLGGNGRVRGEQELSGEPAGERGDDGDDDRALHERGLRRAALRQEPVELNRRLTPLGSPCSLYLVRQPLLEGNWRTAGNVSVACRSIQQKTHRPYDRRVR